MKHAISKPQTKTAAHLLQKDLPHSAPDACASSETSASSISSSDTSSSAVSNSADFTSAVSSADFSSTASSSGRAQDRRVRKTKNLLRHCLAELLRTKKINEITVKELTDMADLNRGTFYLHYRDVYDLLEQTEHELMQEFYQLLNKYDPGLLRQHSAPIFAEIFAFVLENRDIVSILMGENGDLQFQNKLRDIIKDKCLNDLMELYLTKDPETYTVFFYFMLSGCIGIVQYWLRTGCRETPEVLAKITEKIILDGIHTLEQE